MMCPDRETQLNEYVDGLLAASDRAAVEAHLAGCAGCRAAVTQLRGLVAGARQLPRSIEPPRDLWVGIAAQLGQRVTGNVQRAWWRQRLFWGGALAAAATLVIALGIYRLLPLPLSTVRHPAGESWTAVQADYERAAAELDGTLAGARGRLRPETVALLERNRRIIDAAISEARAALARDPGSAELRQLYAAAYRQKVELLRWAARVALSS
jgi:putative zinc finger protein